MQNTMTDGECKEKFMLSRMTIIVLLIPLQLQLQSLPVFTCTILVIQFLGEVRQQKIICPFRICYRHLFLIRKQ